jgi:hypothetical protein
MLTRAEIGAFLAGWRRSLVRRHRSSGDGLAQAGINGRRWR